MATPGNNDSLACAKSLANDGVIFRTNDIGLSLLSQRAAYLLAISAARRKDSKHVARPLAGNGARHTLKQWYGLVSGHLACTGRVFQENRKHAPLAAGK